jgi:hypothetical protein
MTGRQLSRRNARRRANGRVPWQWHRPKKPRRNTLKGRLKNGTQLELDKERGQVEPSLRAYTRGMVRSKSRQVSTDVGKVILRRKEER